MSRESVLRRTITDSIFYQLMRQSDLGVATEAAQRGEAGEEEEEDSELVREDMTLLVSINC